MLLSVQQKYSISQIMGYLKGKKQFNDIRQACKLEIQIREQTFLCRGILCGYRGMQ